MIRYRAVKGNDLTLTHVFYGADEETATDATGNVTVTVEREDGTSLTGGTIGSNNGTTGEYDFALTAATHLDELDELKITWTATVDSRTITEIDYVNVVGGRYFTLTSLRSEPGLSNMTTFTNQELKDARDIAEDFIEQYCEHAWVPSYSRYVFDGNGGDFVLLPKISSRRIIAATISGTAQTTSSWSVDDGGRIITDGTRFTQAIPAGQNCVIKYEWGEQYAPLDLQRAARKLARHLLLDNESSIPDRARLMQTEWAMFHLDTASEDKPTGMPEVDSVLMRYRAEQPGWIFD